MRLGAAEGASSSTRFRHVLLRFIAELFFRPAPDCLPYKGSGRSVCGVFRAPIFGFASPPRRKNSRGRAARTKVERAVGRYVRIIRTWICSGPSAFTYFSRRGRVCVRVGEILLTHAL